MLVVLAIMSLVLSIVGAGVVKTIEANKFSRTTNSVIKNIKHLRLRAILEDHSRQIIWDQTDSLALLNLPEGWRVDGDVISISKTGYCSGGTIIVSNGSGRTKKFELTIPKCEVKKLS
jgi:Tfp pilus assembly protein FimT